MVSIVVEDHGDEARVVRQRLIFGIALAGAEIRDIVLAELDVSLLTIERLNSSHLRIGILIALLLLLLSENLVVFMRRVAQLRRQLLIQQLFTLESFAQFAHARLQVFHVFPVFNQSRFLLLEFAHLLIVQFVSILNTEKTALLVDIITHHSTNHLH